MYVYSFDRFARSIPDLLRIVEQLKEKDVERVSKKESIDTSSATGKLMLTIIAAIAEFECENMLERQREGIAIAKAKGAHKRRQKKWVNEDKLKELYEVYKVRKISESQMAKEMGVSRPTLSNKDKKR